MGYVPTKYTPLNHVRFLQKHSIYYQSKCTCLFFRMIGIVKVQPFTFERGKDMMIPSLINCLGLWLALTSIEGLSLPMFGAAKRCLPVGTMIFSLIVLRGRKSYPSKGMLFGGIITLIGIGLGGMLLLHYYNFRTLFR